MQWNREEILARLNQVISGDVVPHNKALGFRAIDCGPGTATVLLPYDRRLVGNPETGVLHGGVITSLLDATSGMAVFLKLENATRIATLDLRIDYLCPAEPERDVHGRCECYKITRSVAFTRGVAYHDDPDDPIATSAGTFMIFRDEESVHGHELGGM